MTFERFLFSMGVLSLLFPVSGFAKPSEPPLTLPAETPAILGKIYSFELSQAINDAQALEQSQPNHPLGYLLEAEAIWWRIWCTSSEFKYGMTDARHRAKLDSDQHYVDLAVKVTALAEKRNKQQESAEMAFYAGMGDALAARLYGLRGENRNAARAGVRGREHLSRAIALDPRLADADLGLGLYNYYVDTLSTLARVLRFFMGIPGGSKQEGLRQLEHDISEGVLTPDLARFYLALNLHRYDLQYQKALAVITPLTERFPSNPVFQLARGDLLAKLGRKQLALACYRAAVNSPVSDAECQRRVQELARLSIAALGLNEASAGP
jgi:tetratricopeptide (TPR) repeat protein